MHKLINPSEHFIYGFCRMCGDQTTLYTSTSLCNECNIKANTKKDTQNKLIHSLERETNIDIRRLK